MTSSVCTNTLKDKGWANEQSEIKNKYKVFVAG